MAENKTITYTKEGKSYSFTITPCFNLEGLDTYWWIEDETEQDLWKSVSGASNSLFNIHFNKKQAFNHSSIKIIPVYITQET